MCSSLLYGFYDNWRHIDQLPGSFLIFYCISQIENLQRRTTMTSPETSLLWEVQNHTWPLSTAICFSNVELSKALSLCTTKCWWVPLKHTPHSLKVLRGTSNPHKVGAYSLIPPPPPPPPSSSSEVKEKTAPRPGDKRCPSHRTLVE